MITLISRWKVKNGVTPTLRAALDALAGTVAALEPDTLTYIVNVVATDPLGTDGAPIVPPAETIPDDNQDEVVFFEVYRDAAAFARHLSGVPFTTFVSDHLSSFYEDPNRPGSPLAITEFLTRRSSLVRPEAVCAGWVSDPTLAGRSR